MFGRRRLAVLLGVTFSLGATGCQSARIWNPIALQQENQQLRQANRACQDQLAQLQARVDALDQDNQELHRLLAQEQARLYRGGTLGSAAPAVRGEGAGSLPWQSTSSSIELASRSPLPPAARGTTGEKAFGPATGRPAWTASSPSGSTTGRSSARGYGAAPPMVSIPGADVEQDGDVVRIRITKTPVFDPGKATIRPEARPILDRVARVLKTDYADYIVGIEGHTDSDPIRRSKWGSNHELATERALAVFEYLTSKGVPANRLYIAAYGPLRPIASNNTAAGKARNRRVEFVVSADTQAMASR
jgi:flagellar motor protein MotB